MILSFRNKKIYYNVLGAGDKVIMLIHGFPTTGDIFQNQAEFLSRHYKVIVPDLPGIGKSEYNDLLQSIDDFADALYAILEAESVKNCVMIGHSMGGYITLAFADKYCDKLQGLGLIHSHALPDDEEKRKGRIKAIQSIEAYGSSPFIKKMIPGMFTESNQSKFKDEISFLVNELEHTNEKGLIRFSEIMMNRPDRQAVLKRLKIPVLFILGEEDKLATLEAILPQTYLSDETFVKILASVAHMSMVEDPTDVNETIDEFVANV